MQDKWQDVIKCPTPDLTGHAYCNLEPTVGRVHLYCSGEMNQYWKETVTNERLYLPVTIPQDNLKEHEKILKCGFLGCITDLENKNNCKCLLWENYLHMGLILLWVEILKIN